MRYIFATGNAGKVEQIEMIMRLYNIHIKVEPQKSIGFTEEVIEDGKTFEENSNIKATALFNYCKSIGMKDFVVFADDSGLCVDALDGRPGIYSDRYAGEHATIDENLDKLLEELKDKKTKEERSAKFVSVFTGYLSDGTPIVSRGECKGSIALQRGKPSNLTYNPVFIPEGFDKPMGDLSDEEFKKVKHHREMAFEGFLEQLKELEKNQVKE